MYTIAMDLQYALKELGLNEKEAAIYTTLLESGRSSILDIARGSNLKRSTIYTVVESLESYGLVHRVPLKSRKLYEAAHPSTFESRIKHQKQVLDEVLPQLTAITNVPRGTKPEIHFFEGKDSVGSLYRRTFGKLQENEMVYFVTSTRDLYESFPEIITLFNEISKRRTWKVREIIPRNSAGERYVTESGSSATSNPKHKTRFLPKGVDLFDMEVLLAKDVMVLVSFTTDVFAVSIQSPHFVESFRNLFNVLWAASDEPF